MKKKRRVWAVVLIFALLIGLGQYAIRLFNNFLNYFKPLPGAENTVYSTPIENTEVYTYEVSDAIVCPDDAALILAKQYLNDMMQPSDQRSFRLTKFKDVQVRLYSTPDIEEETARMYNIQPSEIDARTWIVEIDVAFQYEGTISPIGSIENEWIDGLYQSSPIGFLLTQNSTEYTMQSRYLTANDS